MARKMVARKTYIDKNGEESRHASPEAESLRFDFFGDDGESIVETREVTLAEIGENCQRAAAWHGLSQKLGDAYAGESGASAVEALDTVLERLRGDDWVRQGEGGDAGSRPSLVADAVKAALEESGETVDDDRYAAIREKVKGADGRKGALANHVIRAHYERLKAERAKEKAKEAQKKAKEAGSADLSDY